MCRNIGTRKVPRLQPTERELELALEVAGLLQLTKCTFIIRQRIARQVTRQLGLTAREVWILLAAGCGKPITQKTIARHLALNENVLVLLLDRLETSGHAKRVRNPANRREQFVRLTPKGVAVTRRMLAVRAELYRTVLAPLDDKSIQVILKAAKDILAFEAARSKAARC